MRTWSEWWRSNSSNLCTQWSQCDTTAKVWMLKITLETVARQINKWKLSWIWMQLLLCISLFCCYRTKATSDLTFLGLHVYSWKQEKTGYFEEPNLWVDFSWLRLKRCGIFRAKIYGSHAKYPGHQKRLFPGFEKSNHPCNVWSVHCPHSACSSQVSDRGISQSSMGPAYVAPEHPFPIYLCERMCNTKLVFMHHI